MLSRKTKCPILQNELLIRIAMPEVIDGNYLLNDRMIF